MTRAVRPDRFGVLTTLCCLLLSACTPDVVESPHVSLLELRRAVEAGDTATTLRYIDVDAIVSRLTKDILAAGRDSFNIPADDTVRTETRLRLDSIEAQWRAVLRTQLGLSSAAASHDTTEWYSEDAATLHQIHPTTSLPQGWRSWVTEPFGMRATRRSLSVFCAIPTSTPV